MLQKASYTRLHKVKTMGNRPYEKLKFYEDACELRKKVYEMTEAFSKTHMRLVSQMRDAARSAKQNIREGYRKGTLGEFIHSIKISQGSLEELCGDLQDCCDDKLITQKEYADCLKLAKSALYMSTQYVKSMSRNENKKNWINPGCEKKI